MSNINLFVYISIVLGVGVICLAVGWYFTKKFIEGKSGVAKDEAARIIDNAKKEAGNLIKEAELKNQESLIKLRNEAEKQYKAKEGELVQKDKRLEKREDDIEKREDDIRRRDGSLTKKEGLVTEALKNAEAKKAEHEASLSQMKARLETISNMTQEEAKIELIKLIEDDARREALKLVKTIEEEARQNADKIAKNIISLAAQRYAGEYAAERTVSVIGLPSDEMKGRIIGREGRNIRAIEAATGVDLIVDDTPEALIISTHNPIRREIAKLTIQKLISDGRIHPGRIEEIVKKTEIIVTNSMKEAGESAVFDLGLSNVHAEIVKLIGALKYRTSYTQNIYEHSLEVAFICGIIAAELGLNVKMAKRAGLLHDIGKAVDHEIEGTHPEIGANIAKKFRESKEIIDAIAEHHNDSPTNIYGVLVQTADTLSAARPGARREVWASYINRLDDLEKIAISFPGVEKSYAIQAGRELRVIVENKKIGEDDILMLARDIANKIETEMSYPGQIKVMVIRETRATEYAK